MKKPMLSILGILVIGTVCTAGCSPARSLFTAAYKGDAKKILKLVQKGVDVNAKIGKGNTALHAAVGFGHYAAAEALLNNGADVNAKNRMDMTPLLSASSSGYYEIVKLLLANGADVNARWTYARGDGSTALMAAAQTGHVEVVRLLLENGADANMQNSQGKTALMMASAAGHAQIVELLQKESTPTPAETSHLKVVTPIGEYAKIDVGHCNEMMKTLIQGSGAEKQAAIAEVTAKPDQFNPAVFYALSNALFQEGRKDEGAFWFYAGQLRARYDANRCHDISARQAVGVLNQSFGSEINQYMFQDTVKLEKCIGRVLEWDRKTPHHYDHRWINLHGMGAIISGLGNTEAAQFSEPLSMPEEEWDQIAEKTRAEYLEGFKLALDEMKTRKK
ncbi:ankyrin repeat domain-containing protein [candidate division FCPU426 bacterium]|nr:ankyrin repeat domain-containing protein [candidate division FCPU426 bacterium]